MQPYTPLVLTIVTGLVLAYLFGLAARQLRIPALVGYLVAGILVGPLLAGNAAGPELGGLLAELGLILLMFGVGLQFSLRDLLDVRIPALAGAVVQIGCATALGFGLGLLLGWDVRAALLFGLALSGASSVVVHKALEDRHLLDTEGGRLARGWLSVGNFVLVLVVVLMPLLARLDGTATDLYDPFASFIERMISARLDLWGGLVLAVVKLAAFTGFMLVVGRRVIPWALGITALAGSRELLRLAVPAIALGLALGSAALFGVPLALGAFLAGMMFGESDMPRRAARDMLPLREAFAVLFFLGLGMAFEPGVLVENAPPVLGVLLIVLVGKAVASLVVLILFRRPVHLALWLSASLAQIGEFSFILAGAGVALSLLPAVGRDLVLAGMVLSIALNPALFWIAGLIRPRVEARVGQDHRTSEPIEPSLETKEAEEARGAGDLPERPAGHIVLAGYGTVGRIVAAGISDDGGSLVLIEDSEAEAAAARMEGLDVTFGNAVRPEVLRLAGLPEARMLLLAVPDGFEAGAVCASARRLKPDMKIIACAASDEEEALLRRAGAGTIIRGEREAGKAILAVLRDAGHGVPEAAKLPEADNILAREAAPPPEAASTADPEPVSEAEAVAEAVPTEAPAEIEVLEAEVKPDMEVPAEPDSGAPTELPPATLEPIIEKSMPEEVPAAVDEVAPVAAEEDSAEPEPPAAEAVETGPEEATPKAEDNDVPPVTPEPRT